MPDISGIGYGICTILAFNFLKSNTICTVPFGLGMINLGLAQAIHDASSSIHRAAIRCISVYRVYICMWGTGNGLICTGSVPGLTSNFTGGTLNILNCRQISLYIYLESYLRTLFVPGLILSESLTMTSISAPL